jgi:hypothetical protein
MRCALASDNPLATTYMRWDGNSEFQIPDAKFWPAECTSQHLGCLDAESAGSAKFSGLFSCLRFGV